MQTVIHTIQGTFIVPSEKQAALIHWLQENAVRSESVPVREQVTQPGNFTNRQLINEGGYIGD
jgi:hypothetical protein